MRALLVLVHILLIMALSLLTVGCAGGTALPAQVRGQVFFKNGPLSGGVIVFTPDASRGGNGPLARAEVQADGSYHLHTKDGPGIVAGWYRVTVMAVEATSPGREIQGFVVPRSLLPEKYRDPESSGLVREVQDGRENRIDFHLE